MSVVAMFRQLTCPLRSENILILAAAMVPND